MPTISLPKIFRYTKPIIPGRFFTVGNDLKSLDQHEPPWQTLRVSGLEIANANPGNTNDNSLLSVVLPGGLIGKNGAVRMSGFYSMTGSTNSKTMRAKLGGTTFFSLAITAVGVVHVTLNCVIFNRNSFTSQFGGPFVGNSGFSVTAAINTSIDQNLEFSAQLGTGTETLSLQAYTIETLTRE